MRISATPSSISIAIIEFSLLSISLMSPASFLSVTWIEALKRPPNSSVGGYIVTKIPDLSGRISGPPKPPIHAHQYPEQACGRVS